ncbi:MAG: AMP-binding protein [Actinobacteria bacterium]|nr:AMP-binding protein [Actinomycetota bacterium]
MATMLSEGADSALTEAAVRWPRRCAVRDARSSWSFAELNARVNAFAAVVTERTSEPGAVVAVSSPLDIEFIVGYYGTLRAGRIVAVLNPLMGEQVLLHNLNQVRPELCYLDPATLRRVGTVRSGLRFSMTLMRQGDPLVPAAGTGAPGPAVAGETVACYLFTSGTTGKPKTVVLSHRNLSVNAAQVAQAHQLTAESVSLNYLPSFHPMHLSSALHSGSTQVLHLGADPATAVARANEVRASHFYTIPMRLNLLARHPNLADLELPSVRLVASGGSALAPAVARRLATHFRVPVIQGYGLAEAAPLVTSDRADAPVPGSVGTAVSGTECRIVEVGSGRPVPPGQRGEVQVRGPQVMLGYLDQPAAGSPVDADGWLSTGDLGRMDAEGVLFLVDRLKDTFKCDNWLVSPSDLQDELTTRPGIADCAVFGLPDDTHGQVVAAMLVLEDGLTAADATAILAEVAAGRPYYERVRRAVVVADLPRSANQKIDRRQLCEQLLRGVGTPVELGDEGAPA